MTNIQAFIKDVKDEKIAVSRLLRDAKLIADKLEQLDFLSWINLEIKGYEKGNNYPDYRVVKGQMKAWNPFHGWVPVLLKTSEEEEQYCKRKVNQSIREIEEILLSTSDSFEMPYPASFANQIIEGDLKTKVSMFIDRSAIIKILDMVRNRLLDWANELKNKGIQIEDTQLSNENKKEAKLIESKYKIENIENFNGSIGENNNFSNNILTSAESFWGKAFWYIFVALIVVIAGNIISALILKNIWGI